jgi:hypothetical protein
VQKASKKLETVNELPKRTELGAQVGGAIPKDRKKGKKKKHFGGREKIRNPKSLRNYHFPQQP